MLDRYKLIQYIQKKVATGTNDEMILCVSYQAHFFTLCFVRLFCFCFGFLLQCQTVLKYKFAISHILNKI